MKAIGPTFGAELAALNLIGLNFSWDASGSINFGAAMAPEQIAAVEAVYAAHDPSPFGAEKLAELGKFRSDRRAMFALIGDTGFVALATNDTATATALVAFRQGLKDLPAWPAVQSATNLAQLKAALAARYKTLTNALPPAIKAEFKELAS